MADEFTHIDADGKARMVDVSEKSPGRRRAIAAGFVHMNAETLRKIREGSVEKGEVLSVARLAGIMGAKRTDELIPLCHGLPLEHVDVEFTLLEDHGCVAIEATATTTAKTGVEMEALTAVSVAGLTIYDMVKAVDKSVSIRDIHLVRKEGGKSGLFENPDPPGPKGWR